MAAIQNARKPLRSVLYVEDEEDIQHIVRTSLERIGGMRVHACHDPLRALEMARDTAPDMILLDLRMPSLDGKALLHLLQADPVLARIPVVFLTASATRETAEALQATGAARVLFKPIDMRELPGKLAEVWDSLNG
jgi:CheY-like chemotaxis protein